MLGLKIIEPETQDVLEDSVFLTRRVLLPRFE
jgi:hypothetical protein